MCFGRQLIFKSQPNILPYSKGGSGEVAADDHRPTSAPDSASSKARTAEDLKSRPQATAAPPLVQFMKYMVHSVLVLVALKYQGNPETLFRGNPAPLWCFLVATSVYWLIVDKMKQTTVDANLLFHRAAFATAILSALSLLSMVFHYPVSLVPLLIWIPLPVVMAWPRACYLIHRCVVDKAQAIVAWARGGLDSIEEASNLPL